MVCLMSMAVLPLMAAQQVKSLGDLRNLEEKIKAVVEKGTPATISMLSAGRGGNVSGSGVVVTADGLILTAAHVVQGNTEMTVVFPDGQEARAKVLGANYYRDAAMAQLIGDGPWPFVEVGDSAEMATGDLVVAMGHPKGYDPTRRPPVRFGRIMSRQHGETTGFFTTDCTVIGGDSGGPLFNLEGQVVGIHSSIDARETRINHHAGIAGFKKSWAKMKAGDQWGQLGGNEMGPDRPVIGVLLEASESGLKVMNVPRNSPAEAGGIRNGDVILSLAEEKVDSLKSLARILVDFDRGDSIKVGLERGGEALEKNVKLASRREIYRQIRR